MEHARHLDGLEISPADAGFIIYRPDMDRVHYLNHTAVVILELCNGENSSADIAGALKQAYGLDQAPVREVDEMIARMEEEGLIVPGTTAKEALTP